ncbi:MAG: riboflavin biosynthesis protein RibF [bacterium]
MQVYYDFKEVGREKKIALAIGNFDGVHLGHRKIIEKCKRNENFCIALTFDIHPRELLYPSFAPRFLTLKYEKYSLLKEAGVDAVIELPFEKYCSMDPVNFLNTLDKELFLDSITIGFNFFFGKNQKGNADLMFWWGRSSGVRINIVPPVIENGMRVSSTVIREFIATGEVWNSYLLLSYPYVVTGSVVKGRKIGRTINFPTLNLNVPGKIIPPDGVYFTRTVLDNREFFSLTNIGTSPTIDLEKSEKKIETWIADKDVGEVYGEDIAVYFYKKVRDEIKFSSKEKLLEMMLKDKAKLESFKKSHEFKKLPLIIKDFS